MNIDAIRAAVLVTVAALSLAVGWQVRGWKEGYDAAARLEAEQAQDKLARELVAQVAEQTGKAIADIKVTSTTIYQRTRQEIIREPMDPACRLPAGWMRNINDSRTGRIRPEPAGAMP